MVLEKEEENFKWYRQGRLKVKVQDLDNVSMVWVAMENYNICRKLVMYDILERVKEDMLMEVKIQKDENNQRGFVVDSDNAWEFIQYIEEFVDEWDIKITKDTVSEADLMEDGLEI